MIPRSVRHRLAPRARSRMIQSRYPWRHRRYFLPVVSPYLDRLQRAACEPCWRTSEEGREYVAKLERILS